MSLEHRREKWLYPVVIDSGNGGITVTEDGGSPVAVSVTAGTYYVHNDTGGLLQVLAAALNAHGSLSGTYSFEPITPTQTMGLGRCGVRMRVTGLSTSLSVTVFSGAAPTRPALEECLGLGTGGTFAGVADGSDFIVDGPFSYAGSWVPYERVAEHRRSAGGILYGSSEYTERTDFYALDYGRRTFRTTRYEYLPSTRIFVDRATVYEYAINAEEAEGDTGNAFESMWREMRRGASIYVVHYEPGERFTLDSADTSAPATYAAEELRVRDLAGAQDFSSMASVQRLAGEYYSVTFESVVVASSYAY
jgi:hypothetical protein